MDHFFALISKIL